MKHIYYILLLGTILRILFFLVGADIYYQGDIHLVNDSNTYYDAFYNWWTKGIYSFDLTHPDAYFGRLPGYPLFWGIHYLIFDYETAHVATAVSQTILEVICIYLLYRLCYTLHNKLTATIAAFIYATYPFIIVWNTIILTESFATSLTIVFFWTLYCLKENSSKPIFVAITAACCFYTREYLGILIISVIIYYLIKYKFTITFFKYAVICSFTFIVLYSAWPIRNYLTTGRVVFIKTENSGYWAYGMDFVSARKWFYAWTDSTEDHLINMRRNIDINSIDIQRAITSKYDEAYIRESISMATKCGRTFLYQRGNPINKDSAYCSDEVTRRFSNLFKNYIKEKPVAYLSVVPFQLLKKAFFKLQLRNHPPGLKGILISVLFSYRTIIICFAILGFVIALRAKYKLILPVMFFTGFMYIFICFYMRQLEMRYLLQADIMLIIPASITINWLTNKIAPNYIYKI